MTTPRSSPQATPADSEDSDLNLKALAAAAVVAVIGAFLWRFVAMTTEYEFGLLAWVIGGAVGFAAGSLGARGLGSGIACGILALLAILGGKYLIIQTMQEEFAALADEFQEEVMQEYYTAELASARVYVEQVESDADLRDFMVEHEYTDAWTANDVSDEELDVFREDVDSRLQWLATEPTFDEWLADLTGIVADASTIEIMREDFGLVDLVFLVLGVGTAFRLGTGQ